MRNCRTEGKYQIIFFFCELVFTAVLILSILSACCDLKLIIEHAKLLQSCPVLYSAMNSSLSGSFVHGILQVRILEWVAMSSSRGSSQPRDGTNIPGFSCIVRCFFYHQHHQGSLLITEYYKSLKTNIQKYFFYFKFRNIGISITEKFRKKG